MGLRVFATRVLSRAIDGVLNVRTTFSDCAAPNAEKLTFADPIKYEPIDYILLRRILRDLRLQKDDVFIDIGCGAGRAPCVAARKRIRKAIGIEYDPSLANIAARNASSMSGRRADITILNEDAARADYSEGTVFFLYNPFGEQTLAAVVEKIRETTITPPRLVRIAYAHPKHAHVLERSGWLKQYGRIRLPLLYTTATLWSN